MEVTMQWWDDLDDLWFAVQLRLSAWYHWLPRVTRAWVTAAALLLVFSA